jgi:hypothetical protein
MKYAAPLILLALLLNSYHGSAQDKKGSLYFDHPGFTDSASTIMIPIQYSEPLFTSDKLAGYGGYYANIIFYDFTTDRSHKLFEHNTYIKHFGRPNPYNTREEKHQTEQWIFYQVRDTNTSGNKRIDGSDPTILYISDLHGNNLKRITQADENLLSFELYEKKGFALLRMQRDVDGNGKFSADDRDYYYVRLELKGLTLGNKIEIR